MFVSNFADFQWPTLDWTAFNRDAVSRNRFGLCELGIMVFAATPE